MWVMTDTTLNDLYINVIRIRPETRSPAVTHLWHHHHTTVGCLPERSRCTVGNVSVEWLWSSPPPPLHKSTWVQFDPGHSFTNRTNNCESCDCSANHSVLCPPLKSLHLCSFCGFVVWLLSNRVGGVGGLTPRSMCLHQTKPDPQCLVESGQTAASTRVGHKTNWSFGA